MAFALAAGCGAEGKSRQENNEQATKVLQTEKPENSEKVIEEEPEEDKSTGAAESEGTEDADDGPDSPYGKTDSEAEGQSEGQSEGQLENQEDETGEEGGNLEVHFIDVGQGDATLIKCDGEAMLIDAGDNDKGTKIQLYLKKQGVDQLQYLVGTHPDADHIGGMDVIITKFTVNSNEIWMPDCDNDTATYRDVVDAIEYKRLKRRCPEVGETFSLGKATITILAPINYYEEVNNNSIVLKIQNGNNSFIFTGDASEDEEMDLVSSEGSALDADVLKVGHHGSKHSTSGLFLNSVTPEYAVISVSSDNSYGHPTSECLNSLRMAGVKVFRTDEQGSIVAISDGNTITWNCSPSETWQAGENIPSEDPGNSENNGFVPASTSEPETVADPEPEPTKTGTEVKYILNKNTKKFHYPSCSSVGEMKEKNKEYFTGSRDEAISRGFVPCKRCNP